MAYNLPAVPLRMFDNNGNVISGAKLYVYQAGTLTPTDSYTTDTLLTPNTNPVVASASGAFPQVWLKAGDYKLLYTDAADVALFPAIDNYTVAADGSEISFLPSVKTANFTVLAGDRGKMFLVDASGAPGANVVVTADSDTLTAGFPFSVVNTGASGTVTIQGTGGQTVDGVATLVLSVQNAAAFLNSMGAAGWQTLSKSGVGATADDVATGTNNTLTITPSTLKTALWGKGTAVAGAATITIGNGGLTHITGDAWTCSDVDFAIPVDGRAVSLIVDGTGNTFTHSATLVCPGARDFKPQAGTLITITQDDADTVILATPQSSASAWIKLYEVPISGADIRFAFDSFPSFNDFKVVIVGGGFSTLTAVPRVTISNDGGATFLAGTLYHNHSDGVYWNTATTVAALTATNAAAAFWTLATSGAANSSTWDIETTFFAVQSAALRPRFNSQLNMTTTTGTGSMDQWGFGYYSANTAVNEVKYAPSAGTWTGGTAILMGRA